MRGCWSGEESCAIIQNNLCGNRMIEIKITPGNDGDYLLKGGFIFLRSWIASLRLCACDAGEKVSKEVII